MPPRIAILMPLLVLALLVMGCASATPPSRQDVLASLTDHLIVPRFQTVAAGMGELRDALDSLCANPTTDTLGEARTAWREARAPWMRSQSVWFGPVMDRRSRTLVDWSPVDPERIEATWPSGNPFRPTMCASFRVHPARTGSHRVRHIRGRRGGSGGS